MGLGKMANIQNRDLNNVPKIDYWTGWTGTMHGFRSEWWFTIAKRLFRVIWYQDSHPSQSYVRLQAMIPSRGWSTMTQMPAEEFELEWKDLENHTEQRDLSLDDMWGYMMEASILAARAFNA